MIFEGRGGILLFLFFLLFFQIEALEGTFNKTLSRQQKICDATGCRYPGFTGPIIVIDYQPSETYEYILNVPVGAPWQVIFVDGTCFGTTFVVTVEDTVNMVSQFLQVTSLGGFDANEPTQLSAQVNQNCGNIVRSFTALGPPLFDTPYDTTAATYPPNFRITVTTPFGTEPGHAFLQVVPYYATDFVGFGVFPPAMFPEQVYAVTPWQIYVPSDGITIPTLCTIRGGFTATSNGSSTSLITNIATFMATLPQYDQGRFLMDDGTGVTCWSVAIPSAVQTFISDPLECAQVTAGSIPVICHTPNPPLYCTFPT